MQRVLFSNCTTKSKPYDCFCPKFECNIVVDGLEYPTAEHFMQAMKYLQETKQEAIRLASWEDLPSLAKCNSDIRPDWQWKKLEFMERVVRAKVAQNPEIAEVLLSTEWCPILYNSFDNFWGIGGANQGQNNLGKIWMAARKNIQKNLAPCPIFISGECCPDGVLCRHGDQDYVAVYDFFDFIPQEALCQIILHLDFADKVRLQCCISKKATYILTEYNKRAFLTVAIKKIEVHDWVERPWGYNSRSYPSPSLVLEGVSTDQSFLLIRRKGGLWPCLCTRLAANQEEFPQVLGSRRHGLSIMCNSTVYLSIAVGTDFGFLETPLFKWKVPAARVTSGFAYYCYNSEAKIHLYSVFTEQEGDVLLSQEGLPTTVKHVQITEVNGNYPMVRLCDFWITRGHPIYINGDWYRPDELFPFHETYIDNLYNYYLEPHHEMVVGERAPLVCGGLGSYCPRLAALDPVSDALYGTGYNTPRAERYSWLLSLPHRIPDELVEEETDKYWAMMEQLEASATMDIV